MFQYLGKNCHKFKFLYSNVEKAEFIRFLSHISHEAESELFLELGDNKLMPGQDILNHVHETFQSNGAFMIEFANNVRKINFSSDSHADHQKHFIKLQKKLM